MFILCCVVSVDVGLSDPCCFLAAHCTAKLCWRRLPEPAHQPVAGVGAARLGRYTQKNLTDVLEHTHAGRSCNARRSPPPASVRVWGHDGVASGPMVATIAAMPRLGLGHAARPCGWRPVRLCGTRPRLEAGRPKPYLRGEPLVSIVDGCDAP